jgi:hypothetical protein
MQERVCPSSRLIGVTLCIFLCIEQWPRISKLRSAVGKIVVEGGNDCSLDIRVAPQIPSGIEEAGPSNQLVLRLVGWASLQKCADLHGSPNQVAWHFF